MVVALHDHQRVARHVLPRDEPGLVRSVPRAAYPQPLALSERVIREPVVPADHVAGRRFHRSGRARQVTRQEIAERPLADEADPRGVLLRPRRNALLARDAPHVALVHVPERKHHRRQLLLRQPVQEVALVLGRVAGLQQFHARGVAASAAHARVMAGGDRVGAEAQRVIEEGAELDLAVAQHVRIGRASRLVLAQELREHPLPVFGREVHRLEFDSQHVGDRRRIDQVVARRAVFVGVVVFPVLHEHADHVVPLLLQQPCRDGRVHAARHADDDAPASHATSSTKLSGHRLPAR